MRHATTTNPVIGVPLFVMKDFDPSITQSPPSEPGLRPERGGVGSAPRLRQPEPGEHVAGGDGREPPLSLRIGPVPGDHASGESRGDGDRDRDARVGSAQLLDHQRPRDGVGAETSVLLGDRHAADPQLAELLHDVEGELLVLVALAGTRCDLLRRELADEVADLLLLGRELELHPTESTDFRLWVPMREDGGDERYRDRRSAGGRPRGVRAPCLARGLPAAAGGRRRGGLDPEDLEALAKSAWWIGLATESIAAFERAYALHLERGNRSMAAMMALTLRREYGARLAGSVAQAWLHRAEHLLEGEPEAVAHGYLEIAHRELDFDRGNIDGALAHLDRAKEIASRLDDADLPVWVAMSRAEVLGTSGRLDEAFGLMEAAAAVAVGGELGPFTTGAVFCNVMSVCRETADYRRGTEWADVSKRWCERQDITGFPGICRVHRAEFMRLTGAWTDAASEAETGIRRAAAASIPRRPAARSTSSARFGSGWATSRAQRMRSGRHKRSVRSRNRGGRSCSWRGGAPTPRRPRSKGASRRSRGTSSPGPGCSPRRRRSRRRWATSPRRRPTRRSSR